MPRSTPITIDTVDEMFGRTSDQVLRAGGLLAGVPTYVITASATAGTTPSYGLDGMTQLEIQHQLIAQVSRSGYQRTITSSHMVMHDRPEVVISAAREMIDAARAHRAPSPLPPSENLPAPTTDILQELFANPRGLLPPLDPTPP